MKERVALITFHAAHNYGSVLQTLATAKTLSKLNKKVKVINYRPLSQKKFYSLTTADPINEPEKFAQEKADLGDLYDKKVIRAQRFEKFISHNFNLTKEFTEFEPALKKMAKYKTAISGSDQILNKNTAELTDLPWDYMYPYLLNTDVENKVSYASSFANTTDEQLETITPHLKNFNSFSVREDSWRSKIDNATGKKVVHVCDPTFLLTKEEWVQTLKLEKKEGPKYIFFYTLYNYTFTKEKIDILLYTLREHHEVEIHLVAPFCEKSLADVDPRIKEVLDCGPKEFLEELYNAEFVIPESFHGLLFSIIFNKKFCCPCGTTGPELRKIEAMNSVGLGNQWRPNCWEIKLEDMFGTLDFTEANKKMDEFRQSSLQYLKEAVSK